MPAIPQKVRERVSELGRLSGPLDESRAAVIGRALAETLAKQLTTSADPILVIGLFEARIESEVQKALGSRPSPMTKQAPKLSDVLQKFS